MRGAEGVDDDDPARPVANGDSIVDGPIEALVLLTTSYYSILFPLLIHINNHFVAYWSHINIQPFTRHSDSARLLRRNHHLFRLITHLRHLNIPILIGYIYEPDVQAPFWSLERPSVLFSGHIGRLYPTLRTFYASHRCK